VYTRQGNPAWAGQERIGLAPIRASDMFYGNAPGDPKPNWIDTSKVQIPQADEQQRLLVNMIQQMTFTGGPMGRIWYLPSGFKAAVIMTGDDHNQGGTVARFDAYIANSTPNCSVADWQCVRGTSYIWNGTPITDAQAAFYVNQGFELALHGDSNPTCSNWNPTQLDSDFAVLLQTFAANWPSVPTPTTHRMHCISWPDYDSMPAIELAHGMRLDTNYYWFPDVFVQGLTGMFTGSGMAMRFTDLSGNTRDVYQATTQLPDEDNWNWPNDIDILLDNALGPLGYYGIFTANMHTDILDSPGSVAIIASAQARGVPIVTSRQMLTWLDGRNSSSFGSLTWNGTTLGFDMVVGAGARNLQAMLPVNSVGGTLTSISRSGTSVPFSTQTIKGVQYAFFAATAGSYQAVYGGSGGGTFSISGTISGAGGASAQLTLSGAASGTTTADAGGNYTFGSLANGSYTVTPSKAGFTFSPTSTNVTISGSNRSSINFTSTAQTYSLSGNVSGTGGSGATVALSGTATATTTADASGNYSFSSLLNGNYTVTPSRTGFTFSPASQAATVNNANVTGLNFTSAAAVSLSSVAMNPTTVLGGTSSTGTVTLSGPAPSGGILVTLSDTSTSATTPASVTVSAGSATATFTVTTTGVASQTAVTISATYSGTTKQATLTITPPTLSSVTLNPTSVVGGNSSTGTVTLSGPAPSTGTVVTLSDNSSSATTPASVTVTSGNKTATFTITTSGVSSTTTVTVTATFSGVSKTATLTLTKAALTTLSLSPNNVNGGQSSTGTVTLNGNAPSGGATVTLSSSNFIVAQVPISVTIPSGSKTANFTVTTTRRLTGTITISGTYSGVTARGTLTVR
jgi:hypothetical protein